MQLDKYFLIFFIFLMTKISKAQSFDCTHLEWSTAAELMNGSRASIGFAGMAAGVSNDMLLLAGGANFPEKLPFLGGKKHFSDNIYVLEKEGNNFKWNEKNKIKLPISIAYSGYATTDRGLVIVGGDNAQGVCSKSFLLQWNKKKQMVDIKPLQDLPLALTAPAATAVKSTVYVACGDEVANSSDRFFALDLSNKNPKWTELPKAPKALANASLINIQDKRLYLIGGRTKTSKGISDLHNSVYYFDLEKKKWIQVADIFDGDKATPFTATAAFAINNRFILLSGGDKGDVFHRIENYFYEMAHEKSDIEKQKLLAEKNELVMHHQGFSTDVLVYDTKEDKWSKIGAMPYAAQVTTGAVKWNDDLFICSGEIRPGVRSPKIIKIKVNK